MPTYRGLSCTVHTKDGPLEEYQLADEVQPSSSADVKTVYIQAQDAANFWIVYKILPDYRYTIGDSVSFSTHIDGQSLCLNCLSGPSCTYIDEGVYSLESSGEFVQPFQFSEVFLDENQDSEPCASKESLAAIGEISILAERIKRISTKEWQVEGPPEMLSIGKLDEKSLKGRDLTHVMKLCPKEKSRAEKPTRVTVEYLDERTKPYAHFRILYRSKRALQNLEILPRTPSPSQPVASAPAVITDQGLQERAEGEVSQEITRLRTRLESLENKLKAKREVKEEGEKLHNPQVKRIKLSKEVETIDLTLDD